MDKDDVPIVVFAVAAFLFLTILVLVYGLRSDVRSCVPRVEVCRAGFPCDIDCPGGFVERRDSPDHTVTLFCFCSPKQPIPFTPLPRSATLTDEV